MRLFYRPGRVLGIPPDLANGEVSRVLSDSLQRGRDSLQGGTGLDSVWVILATSVACAALNAAINITVLISICLMRSLCCVVFTYLTFPTSWHAKLSRTLVQAWGAGLSNTVRVYGASPCGGCLG
jgi:hypothetical protein